MWSLLVVLRFVSRPVPETLFAECWGESLKPTVAKFSRLVGCWFWPSGFCFNAEPVSWKWFWNLWRNGFHTRNRVLSTNQMWKIRSVVFGDPLFWINCFSPKSVIFTSPSYLWPCRWLKNHFIVIETPPPLSPVQALCTSLLAASQIGEFFLPHPLIMKGVS